VRNVENASTETIEFALPDQRFIQSTTRHPDSACRGFYAPRGPTA
jgi:hypothetical protein